MTSFVLAAVCAGLCVLNAYLGFVRPPQLFRHYAQTGAVVFFFLAIFIAYFGWREIRAVHELAELIDPVPEVVSILYVPTAGEIQAIAKTMAAVPGTARTGTTRTEREQLAKNVGGMRARYWRLDTTLSPGEVISFYREQSNRRDWKTVADAPPFLTLNRGAETLMIYTSRDRLRSRTEVWYTYRQGDS